jgi:DNA invertase Pin-like site-specific DNA recombinase
MSFTRSAVIYARISRDPGETREGVMRQVQDAVEWIGAAPDVNLNTQLDGSPIDRKHPELGHWPPGVFVDNDISARKGSRKRRPEYERAMACLHSGDATMVVTKAQSRLWRNSLQRTQGLSDLRDLDVRLRFLNTGSEIDLSRPADKLMVGVMGEFDSYEAEVAAERQQDSTRHAAKAGAYHGARPFGFRLAHVNPDGRVHDAPPSIDGQSGHCPACEGRKAARYRTLIPDPLEAPAVREAYDLVAAGVSPYQVCQYLDGHEIDGPSGSRISRPAIRTVGGRRWEDVGVQSLLVVLRAKRNIGQREWSKSWAGGKRPPGELSDAHWDAIVDEKTFYAVQDLLSQRHRVRPGGTEPNHLLTGFAYCGNCGRKLRIHKIKGKRRYACSSWSASGCVSRDAESVEAEVQRVLYHWLAGNGMLTKSLEVAGNSDLQKLYATRRKLREQRDELADKLSDDVIDDDTYKRLRERKDKQLADVNRQIDALMASGGAGTRDRSGLPVGAEFRAMWRTADLAERRAILARFVDKVVVHPVGAGNQPDPMLIQVFPGSWANGVEKAQPLPVPAAETITSKGKIATFLREHPGRWFTREDIATATGVSLSATHKNLIMLGAAGDVAREWRRRGGQRACYMFSSATGQSWGPRTRNTRGGAIGAREKVKAYMEASPASWFTAAEIGAGTGAGEAPHVSRTLSELLNAGFIQRRRAPLPRRNVRWEYSVNGR